MKIITFIDSIGRTIVGEEINRTDTVAVVKNPAMISVNQAQNGQLQVQLIPLFFSEFVVEHLRSEGSTWHYNTNNITLGDVQVDARLVEQYTRVFNFATTPQAPTGDSVIKLFDE